MSTPNPVQLLNERARAAVVASFTGHWYSRGGTPHLKTRRQRGQEEYHARQLCQILADLGGVPGDPVSIPTRDSTYNALVETAVELGELIRVGFAVQHPDTAEVNALNPTTR